MIRIGSWNVRTMSRQEKLENIKYVMRRISIQILGLTEVRMKGKGDFVSDDVRLIYSGGARRERGVALLLDRQAAKCVERVEPFNNRLLMVKLRGHPVDIIVVVVYLRCYHRPLGRSSRGDL